LYVGMIRYYVPVRIQYARSWPGVNNILRNGTYLSDVTVVLRRRLSAVSYLALTRVSGEQIELSAAFIVALSDFRLAPTLAWIASK
jgi:hypothetical protein